MADAATVAARITATGASQAVSELGKFRKGLKGVESQIKAVGRAMTM